jgi:phage replication O-like protein O
MGDSRKGFMRLPNDIAEAISATALSGGEYRVLLAIMRQTYGFNRIEKDISLLQSQKITGLAKGSASRALAMLKDKNIIVCRKQEGNRVRFLSINTDLSAWLKVRNIEPLKFEDSNPKVQNSEPLKFEDSNPKVQNSEPILYKDNIKDISLKTTLKTAEEAAVAEAATQIKNIFNDICHSYPQVIVLTEADTAAISITLGRYDIEQFKVVFEKAEASSYLKGDNQRKWRASFDWLIKITNFEKTLNGKYDNSPETSAQNIAPSPTPSEPESSFSTEEWYRQALAYDPEQMFKGR